MYIFFGVSGHRNVNYRKIKSAIFQFFTFNFIDSFFAIYNCCKRVFFILKCGFKKEFKWDIPLLDGYEKEFVENISTNPGAGHFKGIKIGPK